MFGRSDTSPNELRSSHVATGSTAVPQAKRQSRGQVVIVLGLLLGALALMPLSAAAQGRAQGLELQLLAGQGLNPDRTPGWNATLGIGVANTPTYPGAGTDHTHLVPMFSLHYDNLMSISPVGLAVAAIHADGFVAGPVLGYQGYRHESDDLHLTGLGNISASITGGLFAGYRAGPWELLATARQAITHSSNGLDGLVELNYRARLIPHELSLTLGPEVSFGDAEFNRTWFGVSPTQSVNSGLPVYAPGGGVNAYGLHASLTSELGNHLVLHAFGDVRRLASRVTDSPIVARSTEGLIGAGMAYRF